MKTILTLTTLLIFATANAQPQSLPKAFAKIFKSKGLGKDYSLSTSPKPAWIKADFNGDGVADLAVLVTGNVSNRKGLMIIHGKTGEYFVFGAGIPVEKMDDFSWIDRWRLYTDRTAYETKIDARSGDIKGGRVVKLLHPGVLMENLEDGTATSGGIIYFTGKTYRWIHQGD